MWFTGMILFVIAVVWIGASIGYGDWRLWR
jgi:hypothetical protein